MSGYLKEVRSSMADAHGIELGETVDRHHMALTNNRGP